MLFRLQLFGIFFILHTEIELGLAIKYQAEMEQAGQCMEPGYGSLESILSDFKFEKINRTTRAMSFNITNTAAIDDDVGLKIDMEKWVDAGWSPVPFIPFQPNACKLLSKMFKPVWNDLMTTLGVKQPNKCPIPPGNYRMDNYIFDETKFSNFAPFKGRFRYKVMLIRESSKKMVSCFTFVMKMMEAV